MAHPIETLQEKLETRAHRQARWQANKAVDELPHFDRITVSGEAVENAGKQASISHYWVACALKAAIANSVYPQILSRMQDELIDVANQVASSNDEAAE